MIGGHLAEGVAGNLTIGSAFDAPRYFSFNPEAPLVAAVVIRAICPAISPRQIGSVSFVTPGMLLGRFVYFGRRRPIGLP
jgi:hypothetical protein